MLPIVMKNLEKLIFLSHFLVSHFHSGIESGHVSSKILTAVEHGEVIADYFQIDISSEMKCYDLG